MMDEFILASQALNDGLTGAAREEKVRAYKDHIRRIFLGEKPVPRCPDLKPGRHRTVDANTASATARWSS